MINPGDIVLQKKTLVNGKDFRDNKINRLSIVLFTFDFDGKEYVCSCAITNHKPNKHNKNFFYIPHILEKHFKLCSIKLNSSFVYPIEDITKTEVTLDETIMLRIYEKLLVSDKLFDSYHYSILKENILNLKETIINNIKNEEKEEKMLRKQIRREKRMNSKIHQ